MSDSTAQKLWSRHCWLYNCDLNPIEMTWLSLMFLVLPTNLRTMQDNMRREKAKIERERGTRAHASGLISLKAKERAHAMPCDAKRVSPTPLTLSLHRVFTVVFSFYNSRVQNILRASRLILRDQSHHPVAHLRGILIWTYVKRVDRIWEVSKLKFREEQIPKSQTNAMGLGAYSCYKWSSYICMFLESYLDNHICVCRCLKTGTYLELSPHGKCTVKDLECTFPLIFCFDILPRRWVRIELASVGLCHVWLGFGYREMEV